MPPTRAQWVDAQLRRAILHGELAPGERLRAEHLAEQWGVSPTPLRETFMRLAGEGLVVIEPQRGARVAPLEVDDAVELYEMRLLLDPVALDRSMVAAKGDASYAAAVDEAHRRLEARHRTLGEAHDAHRGFHLALVARCPNRRLRQEVEQLFDHTQRYHAVAASPVRATDPVAEHRELAAAVTAGDRRRAGRVLRAHLAAALDAVRAADA